MAKEDTNKISKLDYIDEMTLCINKLQYLTKSVVLFGDDTLEFKEECKTGFVFLADDIIKDIKKLLKKIEQ